MAKCRLRFFFAASALCPIGSQDALIVLMYSAAVEATAARLWQLGRGDGGQLGGGVGSLAEARLRRQWQRVGKRGDNSDFGGSGSALGSAAAALLSCFSQAAATAAMLPASCRCHRRHRAAAALPAAVLPPMTLPCCRAARCHRLRSHRRRPRQEEAAQERRPATANPAVAGPAAVAPAAACGGDRPPRWRRQRRRLRAVVPAAAV